MEGFKNSLSMWWMITRHGLQVSCDSWFAASQEEKLVKMTKVLQNYTAFTHDNHQKIRIF